MPTRNCTGCLDSCERANSFVRQQSNLFTKVTVNSSSTAAALPPGPYDEKDESIEEKRLTSEKKRMNPTKKDNQG
ncbi:uncharacterized protein V6R79_014419 [Siganus canaliculatus]